MKMRKNFFVRASALMTRGPGFMALGALALCSLGPKAMATAVGTINEANCGGGGVTVGATTITWSPTGTVAGTGCIETGLGTSVTYSGGTLGTGVVGNIMNLTAGSLPQDGFMTFEGTTLDFVLNALQVPSAPTNGTSCATLTAGQSCIVFAGSPFLLQDDTNGDTTVSLQAIGTIVDDGVTSNWQGAFTTQLTQTPGSIQTTILDDGSISSTQSAQFTVSSIPEPASVGMIGVGLLALGMIARKRKARV